ncbi:MAG TPA: EscU/YscU/HrcU family type III secretion system export apparatus switch protein [Bryobacteraceae bacterium]|nr:EscU/YscU/HrcU family type III secretion system export apparatus switch protein [Bryobacteraceae bacterium]
MADEQKSEQPTQQRLKKARDEGNFPASREFISAVQFTGFVTLAVTFGGALIRQVGMLMRMLLAWAFAGDVTVPRLMTLLRYEIVPRFVPLMLAGLALSVLSLTAQLATTKLGISLEKLIPDIKRLNPLKKLTSLPGQNLPIFLQALLLLPLVAYVVYYEVSENLDSFLELPWMGAQPAIARIGSTIETLLWRAVMLFLLLGICDLLWQRHRYTKQLKMSKHEVKQESKEQQGSPHIKQKIRRLQRDAARRNMMKAIPTATAVIVNPTHYAVAIKYSMDGGVAPKVVAKGKNYVAARIRKRAIEAGVPIVENAPLARALYTSVDVGQEIPTHLYRAVAEILAYIYKLMNGKLPG